MVKLRCNCGKMEMTFSKMKKSDFPNGWEYKCCKKAKEEAANAAAKEKAIETAKKSSEPKKPSKAIKYFSASKEAPEKSSEAPKEKKRGRPSKVEKKD